MTNPDSGDAASIEDRATLIILDTETTGLDHKTERLIEVAAAKMVDGEVVDTFTSLIKPEVPIRHSSFKIHGISEEMLEDADSEAEVLPKLLEFMDGAPFVAHNAIFDYSFINEAHKRLHSKRWKVYKIDTLDMYRNVFPDEASHGLSSMLDRFGFDSFVSHRALDDTLNLAKCYPKLRQLYIQRKKWQLDQLEGVEYLLERYLRMQKAVQLMQSEMSDLKDVFKLHFKEGGRSLRATSGELMVSSTRRSYEYKDDDVWAALEAAEMIRKGSRLNPRYLDRLIEKEGTDETLRKALITSRVLMQESRNVTFLKPKPEELSDEKGADKEVSKEMAKEEPDSKEKPEGKSSETEAADSKPEIENTTPLV